MSKKETKTTDVQLERVTELQKFQKSLEGLTKEELEAKEQEIIKEADKVNKEVVETKFDLPKDNYMITCNAIRMLLETKIEVQWQYAKAMLEMYDFWNPEDRQDTIVFGALDATLRQLGQLKFKGHDEWHAVVPINEYFEPIRQKYIETSQKIYDVADKHNAIMQELDKINGQESLEKPLTAQQIPGDVPTVG